MALRFLRTGSYTKLPLQKYCYTCSLLWEMRIQSDTGGHRPQSHFEWRLLSLSLVHML